LAESEIANRKQTERIDVTCQLENVSSNESTNEAYTNLRNKIEFELFVYRSKISNKPPLRNAKIRCDKKNYEKI